MCVSASEVLACNHIQSCTHGGIHSDTHIIQQSPPQLTALTFRGLDLMYRTQYRQFAGDVMCDLFKLGLT